MRWGPFLVVAVACDPFTSSATVADAGNDAAAPPTVIQDGGVDAGGGVVSCPPGATCAFFDDGTFGGWTPHHSGGAPDPIIVGGQMFAKTIVDPQQLDISSRLHQSIPTTVKRVRVTFEVALSDDIGQATQQLTLAEIYCANNFVLVNVTRENQVGLTPLDLVPYQAGTTSLPAKARLELDANWSDGHASLRVDGVSADQMDLGDCGKDASFELRLGLGTSTSEAATATYDNVILELDPP